MQGVPENKNLKLAYIFNTRCSGISNMSKYVCAVKIGLCIVLNQKRNTIVTLHVCLYIFKYEVVISVYIKNTLTYLPQFELGNSIE